MSAPIPSVEELSRPAKAFIDSGQVADFGDASVILAEAVPTIIAGPDAGAYGHQAALLTAVECTARAFDHAPVHLDPAIADGRCVLPGLTDLTLAEAVHEAGGHLILPDELPSGSRPMVVIGSTKLVAEVVLQVTWNGWVAHVDTAGTRLPEQGNMVLAPVAAAALAVTECFKRALDVQEACYRRRSLNLWRPEKAYSAPEGQSLDEDFLGPDLRYLPSSAWMVGLGHLGQGFAWCWRLLPFGDSGDCEVQLQDFDKVNAANRTTGMFIRPGDVGTMKSRVVAEALERAGFKTRIVERRLLPETRRHELEPPLAFIGVDKPEPRRLISDVGWTFAVDVGLGSGPLDFTGISIHTFPGARSSHEISAWMRDESVDRAARAQEQDAYRRARSDGADGCGLVQLAETAVAAPFVGVVAACLALAEPLRVLHGQEPHMTLTYDSGRTALPRATRGTKSPRMAFLQARTIEGA